MRVSCTNVGKYEWIMNMYEWINPEKVTIFFQCKSKIAAVSYWQVPFLLIKGQFVDQIASKLKLQSTIPNRFLSRMCSCCPERLIQFNSRMQQFGSTNVSLYHATRWLQNYKGPAIEGEENQTISVCVFLLVQCAELVQSYHRWCL